MNGTNIVSSFSASTLLFKNVIEFWCWVWNLAISPISLTSVKYKSLSEVFWFPYIKDHVICRPGKYDFPLSNCIHLISFSFLMALAKTSRMTFNSSGKSVHLSLVLGLSRNSSSFSSIWCWLQVCHILTLLCWAMLFLYPVFLKAFIRKGFWILWNAFTASL